MSNTSISSSSNEDVYHRGIKNPDYSMNITYLAVMEVLKKFKEGLDPAKRKLLGISHIATSRAILIHLAKDWNKRSIKEKKAGYYLYTNKVALAKQCECDERTIYNHLKRFKEVGLLDKTEQDGKRKILWFNRDCLDGLICQERKNFPPLNKELIELNKNNIKNVDKWISPQLSELRAQEPSKNTKKQIPSVESKSKNTLEDSTDACTFYCEKFWEASKSLLYPDTQFSKQKENMTLSLIRADFKNQSKRNGKKMDDIYFQKRKVLGIAIERIKNYPEFNTPDPTYYFGQGNDGFRFCKAENWFLTADKNANLKILRNKITIQAKHGKIDGAKVSPIKMCQYHAALISETKEPRMIAWFESNAKKLYGSWL